MERALAGRPQSAFVARTHSNIMDNKFLVRVGGASASLSPADTADLRFREAGTFQDGSSHTQIFLLG